MKSNILFFLLLLLSPLLFFSCSSSGDTAGETSQKTGDVEEVSGETSENESKDIYVFDEPDSDTVNTETVYGNDLLHVTYFKVQIGAFTTRERAEEFAAMSRNKLQEEMDITYNEEVNLFVVQLQPSFKSKTEAEKVRDEIRSMEEYKDSWIVTVDE